MYRKQAKVRQPIRSMESGDYMGLVWQDDATRGHNKRVSNKGEADYRGRRGRTGRRRAKVRWPIRSVVSEDHVRWRTVMVFAGGHNKGELRKGTAGNRGGKGMSETSKSLPTNQKRGIWRPQGIIW